MYTGILNLYTLLEGWVWILQCFLCSKPNTAWHQLLSSCILVIKLLWRKCYFSFDILSEVCVSLVVLSVQVLEVVKPSKYPQPEFLSPYKVSQNNIIAFLLIPLQGRGRNFCLLPQYFSQVVLRVPSWCVTWEWFTLSSWVPCGSCCRFASQVLLQLTVVMPSGRVDPKAAAKPVVPVRDNDGRGQNSHHSSLLPALPVGAQRPQGLLLALFHDYLVEWAFCVCVCVWGLGVHYIVGCVCSFIGSYFFLLKYSRHTTLY